MNEEIKDASVDSPELEVLLRRVREAKSWDFDDRKAALIAHINAWADERCNQLAASRAMLPVTDWKIDGGLIYRLNDEGVNCDEINVTMANGSRSNESRNAAAQSVLAVLASPVAGWVSVEDERKPELDEQIIVFVRTVKYGEDDDGRPFEDHGSEIFMGEYRKYGDLEPQFDCFISPISDGDWITHWMPLPAPPAPVTPKQEQSNG